MYRKLTKTIFIILTFALTAFPLSAAFADVSGNAEEIAETVDVYVPEDTSETMDEAEAVADVYTPADTSGNAEEAAATEDDAEPAEPEKSAGINAEAVDKAFSSTRDMLIALADKAGWTDDCNWIVMGLARAGELTEDMGKAYSSNVAKVLAQNESAIMNTKQSSNNSRAVLALTAAGYDVTDIGGYDLLEPLSNIAYVSSQGMNGPIWALIAFDCGAYEIPECDKPAMQTTREKLVNSILNSQRSDHGWAFSGSSSDVDMTCMAIQALAPYYSGKGAGTAEVSEDTLSRVRTAVDEALTWLASVQNEDGTFSSGGYVNSESASQAIVMLTSMGIDPADNDILMKDGKGAVDALMSFYVNSGGFKHISSNYKADVLASTQGYYSLAALYRYYQGKTSLYDMTDVEISHKAEYVPDEEEPEDPDDPSDDPADDKTDNKPGEKDKPDDSAKTPDKAQKSSSKARSKIELNKKNKTSKDKELSDIESLLKKAEETADTLPAEAEKYSEDDLTAIEDIWKTYMELSPAEQMAAESDERWQKYLECTKALAEINHKDCSMGVDLTSNEEGLIPWYVKLVVSDYSASDTETAAVAKALGDGGTVYGFYDLYFINTLDGSVWTPEGIIGVRLMLPEGFKGTPVAVHLPSEGNIELLDAVTVKGSDGASYAEFFAAEFSPYGLAGIDGSLDELLISNIDDNEIAEEENSGVMPWIAACGAGALMLLILAFIRRKAVASEDETASDDK